MTARKNRTAPLLRMVLASWLALQSVAPASDSLKIATFDIDVSPPVGSPLAYDPTIAIEDSLHCKGLVLLPEGQAAIVIAAIDWLGVANEAQDAFKAAMARAAETSPERCAIHSIHQHDAPRCDLSAAKVLSSVGKTAEHFDVPFIDGVVARLADAIQKSIPQAKEVMGIRFGKAKIENVASNRRMLGPKGLVHTTRYTACRDPRIRALPEGVIDPWIRCIVFDGEEEPVAVVTTYATHPQSYYRTGKANSDFPGMARQQREVESATFHVHFNGAGGNIGAGKYNDGAVANRQILADRVADGMRDALESAHSEDNSKALVSWQMLEVNLPPGDHLVREQLLAVLRDESTKPAVQLNTAKKLAYLDRYESGKRIGVGCLTLGKRKMLFMPGELFVEYQLAAQAMRPDTDVLMAAYGEYGTGYIGTRIAYPQGGYEVSERASNVAANAEALLLDAMSKLLNASESTVKASDYTDTSGPLPETRSERTEN